MTEQALTIVQRATAIEQVKQAYIPLLREMVVNGRNLSDQQIVGRAAFAAQQDLDPITEVHTITDKEGRTMAHTMALNGYRRKCLEQVGAGGSIDLEFIEIPKDKLPQGAFAGYECRMRDSKSYQLWQRRLLEVGRALREAMGGAVSFSDLLTACGPAPVTTGIGIIYQSELNDYKDKNFNPLERAKKRAEVNARRHRFPTSAPLFDEDAGAVVGSEDVVDVQFTEAPAQPAAQRTSTELMRDLGYDNDPAGAAPDEAAIEEEPQAQEPAVEKPWTATVVSKDTAMAELSSEGVPYWQMDTQALQFRMTSLKRSITKNGLTPEEKELKQYKCDVIWAILEWRKS